jgi:hypothetical protein
MVPNGLTLIGMNGGPTWNCSVPGTCTTSTVLNGGGAYPAITVTLAIPNNFPSAVANQAEVSGGGSPSAEASDPTPTFSPCDVNQDGSTTVLDVHTIINQALGTAPAINDLTGDAVVDILDVQIVMNAALGLGCSRS